MSEHGHGYGDEAGRGEHWGKHGRDAKRWWKELHLALKILMVLGGVILGVLAFWLFGFVIVWLWNWLMPEIFGLPTITYWQGWGLLALSSLLFKGAGTSGSGSKHRKRRMRDRMVQMQHESDCTCNCKNTEKPGDNENTSQEKD